jgi:hypothetical protein
MIELEVYARGLRENNSVLHLQSQMNIIPQARYKVDANHDLVYFEIDEPCTITQRQIARVFEAIGLEPRFVGQMPAGMPLGKDTGRIGL